MSSAWDRRLAARALAIAGVTALVALVVIVTTDNGASWARRVAMWGAVAPVAGALGTVGAVRLAEARGELRALEALGEDPLRAVLGAIAGGTLIGLAGSSLTALPWADLTALFPREATARVWVVEGSGAMREETLGIRVLAGGGLSVLGGSAGWSSRSTFSSALAPGAASATAAALALAALACPVWSAVYSRPLRKALVGFGALALLIGAFQVVAAHRAWPPVLLAAPLVLLADAVVARYLARR